METAIGRPVDVENLSQHTGLTLPGLLAELGDFRSKLAEADVIVVGIAHNSNELAVDRPCGKPRNRDLPKWSVLDGECARRKAAQARPLYDKLYSEIASFREGKPTILRTINRYNDYIGWDEAHLTPAQERTTAMFIDAWNATLCASAESNRFGCADISKAFNGSDGLKASGALLARDYTHPSDKGNEIIAQTLADLGFAPLA